MKELNILKPLNLLVSTSGSEEDMVITSAKNIDEGSFLILFFIFLK